MNNTKWAKELHANLKYYDFNGVIDILNFYDGYNRFRVKFVKPFYIENIEIAMLSIGYFYDNMQPEYAFFDSNNNISLINTINRKDVITLPMTNDVKMDAKNI